MLDEPTSQLDPQGADDVLAALTRLNADLGTTVLLAEHRLERAAPLADRVVIVADGRVATPGLPGVVLADYPGAPSVTRLGRVLGWDPPPLTVRDARGWAARSPVDLAAPAEPAEAAAPGEVLLAVHGGRVELGGRAVLRGVDLDVRRGDVVALLGRNGSGKTTLVEAHGPPARSRRAARSRSPTAPARRTSRRTRTRCCSSPPSAARWSRR